MKLISKIGVLCALLCLAVSTFAQQRSRQSGLGYTSVYNYGLGSSQPGVVTAAPTATGSGTITMQSAMVTLPDGRAIIPYNTNAPITIDPGLTASETVTPSAVSCKQNSTCTITATFSNLHGSGSRVISGSGGLYECVNDLAGTGGLCLIDSAFSGSSSNVSGARGLYANVGVWDLRGGTNNLSSQLLSGRCSGTATASSTLGLFNLGEYAAVTCTSTVVNLGQVMNHSGTLTNLQVSATTGGVGSSSGVFTVLKNASTTTLTCTLGTATSCSDTTHTATFVAGDVISIQFTTQGSETIAGVVGTVNAQ